MAHKKGLGSSKNGRDSNAQRLGVKVFGGDLLADVLDGGDCCAGVIGDGLAAGVDAGEIGRRGDGFGPCQEVGGLLREKSAAFFLVEEDDGVGWEVFALGGGDSEGGVWLAEGFWGGAAAFGVEDFGVEAAVEEDEEAEVAAQEGVALAPPGVGGCAGRVVEPVAGPGEALAQGGKRGVAGVVIRVEAEMLGGLLGARDGCCKQEEDQREVFGEETHRGTPFREGT